MTLQTNTRRIQFKKKLTAEYDTSLIVPISSVRENNFIPQSLLNELEFLRSAADAKT
ncbi:MAG: hypothetical protein KAW12_02545 [Candidatus Aminicenantes bacterium]|nr:hypothetical protein [Candidatus Aminicenantes bacterium]